MGYQVDLFEKITLFLQGKNKITQNFTNSYKI